MRAVEQDDHLEPIQKFHLLIIMINTCVGTVLKWEKESPNIAQISATTPSQDSLAMKNIAKKHPVSTKPNNEFTRLNGYLSSKAAARNLDKQLITPFTP